MLLGLVDERRLRRRQGAGAARDLADRRAGAHRPARRVRRRSPTDHTGPIPFTAPAKKVLELSWREAVRLGHREIGTEHILLGMVRERHGVAGQVLVELGADLPRTARPSSPCVGELGLRAHPHAGARPRRRSARRSGGALRPAPVPTSSTGTTRRRSAPRRRSPAKAPAAPQRAAARPRGHLPAWPPDGDARPRLRGRVDDDDDASCRCSRRARASVPSCARTSSRCGSAVRS